MTFRFWFIHIILYLIRTDKRWAEHPKPHNLNMGAYFGR